MQLIFNRFVANEITNRFSRLFLVLILVWISFLFIRLIIHFQITSIKIIFSMSVLSAITASTIIIQIAMFIAVLSTVERSSSEHEMAIWLSSGLSLKNWFSPVAKVSAPISIIILILSLFLSPWAYRRIDAISNIYSQEKQEDIYRNAAGRFIESSENNFVFFSEKCNKGSLFFSNVFINKISEDGFFSITVAEGANFVIGKDNNNFLAMKNIDRFDMLPHASGINSFLYHFDNYSMHFNSAVNVKNAQTKLLKCSSVIDLINNNSLDSMAHIVWRLSSLAVFLNLVFIAVPLGVLNPRRGGIVKLLIPLLTCLLYISMTNLVRSLIICRSIDLYVGLFMPHILFLLVNILLMSQVSNLNSYMRRNTNLL